MSLNLLPGTRLSKFQEEVVIELRLIRNQLEQINEKLIGKITLQIDKEPGAISKKRKEERLEEK